MPVLALGDFDVFTDKILGKGGWGKVYLGRQRSLNRQVAVKFLNADMTREADFVSRFRREAQCLASIADDHIIQVYGAGEHEGSQWFAMEFVEGATLQKFIDKGRKFEEGEVAVIGLSVAKALRAAWSSPEKIVHRDIKPSNILVASGASSPDMNPYGETRKHGSSVLYTNFRNVKIKVMDFGLAKLKKEDNEKTLPGTVMGTPKYISPEQAQGRPADIRSDIYSLGVMLFQLAVGRTPFEGETAISLISKHIYDEPPAPSTIDPKVSREMDAVILKCLGKTPEERYQAPEAMIDDLECWLNGKRPRIAMGEKTMVLDGKKIESTGVTIIRKRSSKGGMVAVASLVVLASGIGAAGLVPPPGGSRGWVENLKSHADRALSLFETPDKNPDKDPEPPPEDPVEAARKRAEGNLSRANEFLKEGNLVDARRFYRDAVKADSGLPELKAFELSLLEAEDRAKKDKSRAEDKTEFDRLVESGNRFMGGGHPEDAIEPFEKAIALGKLHGFAELAEAEKRLGEAKSRHENSREYADRIRQASTEVDPEKALELYGQALAIATPEQATALGPMIENKRGEVADKLSAEGTKLEGEKKLQEARESFERALTYKSGHREATEGLKRIQGLVPAGLAYVTPGEFPFGELKTPRDLPGYWIMEREVTNDEFAAFLEATKKDGKEVAAPSHWTGGKVPEGKGPFPVRGVSFDAARKYAEWKGAGWRLPTEEEWEKAARGKQGFLYPWGDAFEEKKANTAKFSDSSLPPKTLPTDRSAAGCFDMCGNVSEWTTTMYDPEKPLYAKARTVKGGSYLTTEREATATYRRAGKDIPEQDVGFRCVWTP